MPTHRLFHPRLLAGAASAVLLAIASATAFAQAGSGRTIGVATPAAPNPAATSANALPSPGGLRSPLITPGGITTAPPAGLPAGSTNGGNGSGRPIPTDATGGGGNAGNGFYGAAPATNVLGNAGAGGPIAGGTGAYSDVDIARSFLLADTDRSRELTRAEAQRLSISPFTFEEMDRNGDGLLSRGEYEDALRAR